MSFIHFMECSTAKHVSSPSWSIYPRIYKYQNQSTLPVTQSNVKLNEYILACDENAVDGCNDMDVTKHIVELTYKS